MTTCPAPDVPDGAHSSPPSSPSTVSDAQIAVLLLRLGESLQVLIHAQATQASQLAVLAQGLAEVAQAIQELIAFGTAQNEDADDDLPGKSLDGLPIRRS